MSPRAAIGYLVGYDASNIWRIWIPSKRRIVRARDVEFDETRFYGNESPPHRIEIFDDSSQRLQILDDAEASQILDEIDLPESTNQPINQHPENHNDQPGHGGVDIGDSTGQFDPNQVQNDQILGDLPLTPIESSVESPKSDDPDIDVPDRPPSPIVLVDNTDFDYSAYLPSNLGKHEREDSSDNGHDDKRQHALAAYFHAFSANQILPKPLSISSLPPPPEDYYHLHNHLYRREFKQAI